MPNINQGTPPTSKDLYPELFADPLSKTRQEWADYYGKTKNVINHCIYKYDLSVKDTPRKGSQVVEVEPLPLSTRHFQWVLPNLNEYGITGEL